MNTNQPTVEVEPPVEPPELVGDERQDRRISILYVVVGVLVVAVGLLSIHASRQQEERLVTAQQASSSISKTAVVADQQARTARQLIIELCAVGDDLAKELDRRGACAEAREAQSTGTTGPAQNAPAVDAQTVRGIVNEQIAEKGLTTRLSPAQVEVLVAAVQARVRQPRDGSSVTVAQLRPVVRETVQAVYDAAPPPAGKDGRDGTDGPQGPAGTDGTAGANGTDGANGADAPPVTDAQLAAALTNLCGGTCRGADGATGADGAKGADGTDGTNGTDGAVGPQGPQGPGISSVTCGPDRTWTMTLDNGNTFPAGGPCSVAEPNTDPPTTDPPTSTPEPPSTTE